MEIMMSAVTALQSIYNTCVKPPDAGMIVSLCINVAMSIMGGWMVVRTIPAVSQMFIDAHLFGRDLCKHDRNIKVPESMGMVSGCIYLVVMFLFLGVPFGHHFLAAHPYISFPHSEFAEFLTSLLCICCMLFLGFADDVLNLKWRYKLVLPTLASLPLLMVYYINIGSTTIVVPKLLQAWLGLTVNIGPLYYLYMAMLAVFCTNAINIYAGINGIESGQSVIIASSVAAFNLIELGSHQSRLHHFSLCMLMPFIGTAAGLFYHNRYPSRAFVGDTFTYFSGMTFAVVAIIGHFSKTVLLFFLPQIFNFVYSVPQLFHLVPCPRHRLPRYNIDTDRLEPSISVFKQSDISRSVLLILRLLSCVRVVKLEEGLGEDGNMCQVNNLTIINLTLLWFGPTREDTLTRWLLLLQVFSSAVAFFVRYPLASFFFD